MRSRRGSFLSMMCLVAVCASIALRLKGPGEIVAVGNGDARGMTGFSATDVHPLYNGRLLAIVRRTGKGDVSLSASLYGECASERKIIQY